MRAQFRSRIRLVLAVILLVALLVIVRLYFIQIVDGRSYADRADHQSTGSGGLFDRGTIYFTGKDGTEISAATLSTGYLVAINPQTLTDPGAAYAAIAAVATTTMSKAAFLAAAAKKSQVYIEVAHHLPDAVGAALDDEHLPGVEVLRERWRYYPGSDLAAQTLGIVSYGSGDALTGQTGLEAQYDKTLARSSDSLYKNFFAELFSGAGNMVVNADDARQGDVVTTIEPEVEARLTEDLAKVNHEYSSAGSGGIIIDPSTGAIIALATYPTYDPNDLSSIDPGILNNPLVENVYEFGSIMKPLTMAAGLDAGAVTTDTTYVDTGCIMVNTRQICNFDMKARGRTTMLQVIEHSLNVGASFVAKRLGQDNFRKYFKSYFGTKTGIDLPGELPGLTNNLDSREQVNFDDMSFGQGINLTPVQMIRALGALANGGVMPNPHVASGIVLPSGITRTLNWGSGTRVFSPQVASEVTQMLITVYPNDARLAINADPSLQYAKVPVAAKTGTAQVKGPGGYYKTIYFHSFFGFFPADHPRYAILLYTNRPQGVEYASETLTGTFMDLTNFLISYYNIPAEPDQVIPLPDKVSD